eukprot:12179624-Alexandrium_andersonii.AAC.1
MASALQEHAPTSVQNEASGRGQARPPNYRRRFCKSAAARAMPARESADGGGMTPRLLLQARDGGKGLRGRRGRERKTAGGHSLALQGR